MPSTNQPTDPVSVGEEPEVVYPPMRPIDNMALGPIGPCPHCGSDANQQCTDESGREWESRVHEGRQGC